jgi:hypothetical protein
MLVKNVNEYFVRDYRFVGDLEWSALDFMFEMMGTSDYVQYHVRRAYVFLLTGKESPGCKDLMREDTIDGSYPLLDGFPHQVQVVTES